MADPIIERDLEFHFTSGRSLYATVRDGRDVIQDTVPGMPGVTKVTVFSEDGTEATMTIERAKLDAVQSTLRVVHPTPEEELAAKVDAV